MGYCVDVSIDITIPKDKVEDCLKAINELHTPENLKNASGGSYPDGEKWHSWVQNPPAGGFVNLQDAFDAWRYETRNSNGDIKVERFSGEKWGDDELLYNTIAPFVSNGNIYVCGEDDEHWKYEFKDGQAKHLSGKIVYQ